MTKRAKFKFANCDLEHEFQFRPLRLEGNPRQKPEQNDSRNNALKESLKGNFEVHRFSFNYDARNRRPPEFNCAQERQTDETAAHRRKLIPFSVRGNLEASFNPINLPGQCPQHAVDRPAGRGQDDARETHPDDSSADEFRRKSRDHADPFRRGSLAVGNRIEHAAPVPLAPPHDIRRRSRWRRFDSASRRSQHGAQRRAVFG